MRRCRTYNIHLQSCVLLSRTAMHDFDVGGYAAAVGSAVAVLLVDQVLAGDSVGWCYFGELLALKAVDGHCYARRRIGMRLLRRVGVGPCAGNWGILLTVDFVLESICP